MMHDVAGGVKLKLLKLFKLCFWGIAVRHRREASPWGIAVGGQATQATQAAQAMFVSGASPWGIAVGVKLKLLKLLKLCF